jgi:predicted ATP-grasp superfamily ATP-dependent carboligase
LIAAVSSRPFVKAAASAGYSVTALDVFADTDTQRAAERVYKIEYTNSGFDAKQFEAALDQIDLTGVIGFAYGSGFEAQPDLLTRIAHRIPLIGNLPETVRRLKNAPEFFEVLDQLNIPHPEVCFKPLANPAGWLCKEEGGSGGTHVMNALAEAALPRGQYYQRVMNGIPVSMLFAANGHEVKVIGFNQQWVAPITGKPYRYGGIVGHANLPANFKQDLEAVANKLALAFGLRGLNSLDVIWQNDAFWVLEINPRLSSTLDLYQSQQCNLFELHVQAVAGDLSQFPQIPSHSKARNVLYAAKDIVIPENFIWPAWTADIPMPLTCIPQAQPICTILAEADNATEAQDLVLSRVQILSNLLFK